MEINYIEKKNIINTIQKLNIVQQRQIFFILRKYLDEDFANNSIINTNESNKWYTKNQNGIFINLSSINNSIIKDIIIFVNECKLKKEKLKVLEKEIQSIENKEICYKIIYEENNELEDFDYLYNNIDKEILNSINDNLNKKFQKKNNLQTKFINATKKYIKTFNYDKKIEDSSVNYILDYEKYLLS
jgi:hypothetical protein